MECLVTGAAGFIGSHLCERLLRDGNRVIGIDCLTDYYSPNLKRQNLDRLTNHRWFEFRPLDLTRDDLLPSVAEADWIFHLAGMPGLVKSWTHFNQYQDHNVLATHRLLEAARTNTDLDRFLYASTSSVYGKYATGDESLPLRPCSPYGITKLAGEQLCQVYSETFNLPVVRLRYFSVFGPGQRPDMGYHKFIDAIISGRPVTVFGDGRQTRGNTYVSDCVTATIAAAGGEPGDVFNVGGGELVSVLDVIAMIQKLTGVRATIDFQEARAGDQRNTGADVSRLQAKFGWEPTIGIEEGLARQIEWQTTLPRRVAA